jgi:hypothetical protein
VNRNEYNEWIHDVPEGWSDWGYNPPRGLPWMLLACPKECVSQLIDMIPRCPTDQLRDLLRAIDVLEELDPQEWVERCMAEKRALIVEYLED